MPRWRCSGRRVSTRPPCGTSHEKAGVATGAAYYYYPSKDAIVMDFYQRSCAEMQPKIEAALEAAAGLENGCAS